MNKKGFTLIELLIVIGILAVLATITVLVLNPAQLFAQARDSQRLSDLASLKGAISLYLTSTTGPNLAPQTLGNTCGTDYWGTVTGATENFSGTPNQSTQVTRVTDGTGWIPVDLDSMSGGSPLAVLPVDPTSPNTATQSYTYQCDNTAKTFEINANMESQRYSSGADNVEDADGGDVTTIYEVGTDPKLDL